ncbi:hypothetical protein PFISCL1PPCAC_22133, partial [Pristionchus fissidentatus]
IIMPPKRKATAPAVVESARAKRAARGRKDPTPPPTINEPKVMRFPRIDPEAPDCIIKWEVENVTSISDNGHNSPTHIIKGINWYVRARTESSERTNNSTCLSLYLYCDEKNTSEVWYADVMATFTLVNREPAKNVNEKFSYRFCSGQTNSGYASLISRAKLINPGEGFINHDRVTVEVSLKVLAVRGIRETPTLRDFTQPQPHLTDGALIVEGKKLYISKQYLALQSPVFEAMFYHGFKESEQEDIVLEDVDYEDFLELLHVAYPTAKPIMAVTAPKLLRLADQFQLKSVLRVAEQFLSSTSEMQWASKLRLADQYNLYDAQNGIMQQLKAVKDFELLKAQKDYILLSDTLKLLISDKQLKICSK